jgi:hypothetical protein
VGHPERNLARAQKNFSLPSLGRPWLRPGAKEKILNSIIEFSNKVISVTVLIFHCQPFELNLLLFLADTWIFNAYGGLKNHI